MSKWNWKHIYAMLADDGKVKIGISKNVDKRIQSIECSKEVCILKVYKTDMCANPYTVERKCHDFFKEKRVFGEWFDIRFEDAVSCICETFEKYADFHEEESNINFIDYFREIDIEENIEIMCMLMEIILRQERQIDSLISSVEDLSESNTEIANTFKEFVTLLNEMKQEMEVSND